MDTSAFTTSIRIGEALRSFATPVRGYCKCECFRQLYDFVYGEPQDKVLILYGLRRTGRTTMIRQIFAEMSDAELAKAAFIQITAKDSLANVNRDLQLLEAQGFHYVFLDEVMLMEDFIEGAALFSDVFAACGMKLVLSGAIRLVSSLPRMNNSMTAASCCIPPASPTASLNLSSATTASTSTSATAAL